MKKSFAELTKEFVGDKQLTAAELWALVKMLKFVRLRCRNNSALNNQLNAAFPYASFRQVQKTRISYKTGLPETYPGLSITVKGETAGATEEEE